MPIAAIDVYHQFQFEVLRNLIQNKGLEIGYIVSGVDRNFHGDVKKIENIITSFLADTPRATIDDFLFPEKLIDLINIPYVLNNKNLDEYSDLEVLFLKLSDRSAAIPNSVQNRRKYYFFLLNHFIQILDKNGINKVLCFDTPHSFFSSLFYHLALKKGIDIIRIEYHYFPNYCLVVDVPKFPKLPDHYKDDIDSETLRNQLPESLVSQLNQKNTYVDSYVSKEQKRLSSDSIFGDLKLLYQYLFKYFGNIAIGIFPFLYKKHVHHFTSLTGKKSEFAYRLVNNKALTKMYRLAKYYKKIARKPQLDTPYIYFGLHMQPEKTTTPLGGHMDNQLAAITIISQSLPTGWRLLVKEHPNQFNLKKVTNQNSRDKFFYAAARKLKNVEFVPLTTSSSTLMKKSKMVATITGTMGWEALMAGKPALIFGDAYYRACRAVGNITDVESCKAEIARLSNINADTITRELLLYLAYYHEKGILVEASNWESKIEHNALPRKEQINNLSEAINDYIVR